MWKKRLIRLATSSSRCRNESSVTQSNSAADSRTAACSHAELCCSRSLEDCNEPYRSSDCAQKNRPELSRRDRDTKRCWAIDRLGDLCSKRPHCRCESFFLLMQLPKSWGEKSSSWFTAETQKGNFASWCLRPFGGCFFVWRAPPRVLWCISLCGNPTDVRGCFHQGNLDCFTLERTANIYTRKYTGTHILQTISTTPTASELFVRQRLTPVCLLTRSDLNFLLWWRPLSLFCRLWRKRLRRIAALVAVAAWAWIKVPEQQSDEGQFLGDGVNLVTHRLTTQFKIGQNGFILEKITVFHVSTLILIILTDLL